MGWLLLAHIGIPVFFGIAFLIFSSAVLPSVEGWESLNETAQDLTILSLGATGAIFDNLRVQEAFGSNAALVAVAVIAINLILAATIVLIRSHAIRRGKTVTLARGIMTLFLGVLTLCTPVVVIFWAYRRGI